MARKIRDNNGLRIPSDDDLVSRCRANDQKAYSLLISRYQAPIYWFVVGMIGVDNAEDLTQEIFIRAYQALGRFRGDSSFKTWLFIIARNRCLTELRKHAEHPVYSLDDDIGVLVTNLMMDEESIEDRLNRQDLLKIIRSTLSEVPDPYRSVLTLYYTNESTYKEIADIMDLPMGTVKTYLHRGRMALKDAILARTTINTGDISDHGEL